MSQHHCNPHRLSNRFYYIVFCFPYYHFPWHGKILRPTNEEVKELPDKYIGSYEKEDYYRWAIIRKESDECIGQIAYFLVGVISKNHLLCQ